MVIEKIKFGSKARKKRFLVIAFLNKKKKRFCLSLEHMIKTWSKHLDHRKHFANHGLFLQTLGVFMTFDK